MYSKIIFYILILAAIVHVVFSIIVLFFPKVINNYTDTTENIVHSIMRGEKTYYREVTSNEKESLKRKTDELDILLKRYPKFIGVDWKFRVITKNLPAYFTYEDYIYIPYHKIDTIGKSTLLHEKVHILQRIYKEEFDNYYLDILNYESKSVELSKKWQDLFLINPDALDINWVFKENGKYYLPLLLKSFKRVVILLKLNKDGTYITTDEVYDFNDFNFFNNYLQFMAGLYNPNELLAEMITSFILEDYNNESLKQFLNQ